MGELNHIYEATSVQLDEVVEIVNLNWEEISERPLIKTEIRTRRYWEEVHRKGRLFLYKEENNKLAGMLSLLKDRNNMVIDLFYIATAYRGQEIEVKMLRLAEKVAANWSVEHISWLFYGKADIEKQFPIFQQLGYVLHCPMDKKGFVLLEKKVS